MASFAGGLPRDIRPPLPPPPPGQLDDPYDSPKATYKPRNASLPPAVPPHPSNWSSEAELKYDDENLLREDDSWATKMVSPRPQRLPGGSLDAARRLEDTVTAAAGYRSPAPGAGQARPYSPYPPQQPPYHPGGFIVPPTQPYLARAPSPYAPGLPSSPAPRSRMTPSPTSHARIPGSVSAGNLSAQAHQRIPSGDTPSVAQMHALSLENRPPFRSQAAQHRRGTSSTSSANTPLVAALPTPVALQKTAPNETTDPAIALSWIQSVLLLSSLTPASELSAQSSIGGPTIATILPQALTLLQKLTSVPSPLPIAYFLRGTLLSSGAHPAYFERSPRAAFKDFEKAGRSGYEAAWFRLGRDYESVGDLDRARDCFERGARLNERSCLYRIGMANLLGQLNLPSNPPVALPMLVRAAALATLEVPQPPYVLGMILLNELPAMSNLPVALLQTALPPDSTVSIPQHALALIQKSAFLHFPPAQYKLGYAYENAQLGLPYDPSLSVRYYSYASQGDELEADMALSKWFLCGAEGYFNKDEGLARTFAEKAARRGLPSAEFAMGYYCEVGVGGPKNVEHARKWYEKAAKHKNADAPARLAALDAGNPELSRTEHETLTNSTLVRSRTQARERSASEGRTATSSQRKENEALAAARRASLIKPSPAFQIALAALKEQDVEEEAEDRRGSTSTSASLSAPGSVSASPGPSRPPTGQGRRVSPSPRRESLPMSSTPPASMPSTPASPPQSGATPVQTAHGRGFSLSETILPAPGTSPSGPNVPVTGPPPKKGPATFEEMGFYSHPLDEQKCVIM